MDRTNVKAADFCCPISLGGPTNHLVLVLGQAPVLPLGPWQAPAVLLAEMLNTISAGPDLGFGAIFPGSITVKHVLQIHFAEWEVGGLSSTGKSFRVVRASALCVCLMSSG